MGCLFSVNGASKIMRERTLEVLVYLFDHYIDEWQDWGSDLEDVEIELLGAGSVSYTHLTLPTILLV